MYNSKPQSYKLKTKIYKLKTHIKNFNRKPLSKEFFTQCLSDVVFKF